MTEGAERGTPREWKLIIDMESGMVSDYFGPDMELGDRPTNEILVREVFDPDPLTEALKVAVEAEAAFRALLDDMTQRAKDIAEYNDKPVELPVGNGVLFEARKALAALERIRNNKH